MHGNHGVGRPRLPTVFALLALISAAVVSLIVVPDRSGRPADAARGTSGPHPSSSGAPRVEPSASAATPSASPTVVRTTPASLLKNPHLARAVSWSLREVPPTAHILTGPVPARALAAVGYPNVVTVSRRDSGMTTVDNDAEYVVSSHSVRSVALSDPVVNHAWRSSVPIAVFGAASGRVIIRQISTLDPGVLSMRHDAAVQSGRQSQQKLLSVPAVRPSAEVRRALRSGELDPRSATALDLAAGAAPLELVRIEMNRAEHAAGVPARRVVIRAASASSLVKALGALPSRYAPADTHTLRDSSVRLTWAIDPVTAGGA